VKFGAKVPTKGSPFGRSTSRRSLPNWQAHLRGLYPQLSRKSDLAKAINYMVSRWGSFARFLQDGRICMTNNAAERRVRTVAIGRKNWTFCGSDRGGHRAAAMYSLIQTCRLNDVDPHAWLRDVIARISDHPQSRLHELLPSNWKHLRQEAQQEPIAQAA
jgi:transposase